MHVLHVVSACMVLTLCLCSFFAVQVRAMQIIDELEVNKRGPYGGGLGHVSFSGTMDMALGLRTMVIPTANEDSLYSYSGTDSRREWTVHLQVRCCCSVVLRV
jgi:hypothetical protein